MQIECFQQEISSNILLIAFDYESITIDFQFNQKWLQKHIFSQLESKCMLIFRFLINLYK